MIGLSSVLCPRQHSIGYMGDRNVSLVILKEYQPTFRNLQTRNIQREDESWTTHKIEECHGFTGELNPKNNMA